MINIEPKHLKIVLDILAKYNFKFYVFGSRITNKARKYSDLDLFYQENIPEQIIIKIAEEFEESDLPYTVDLVNYNTCSESFKKILLSQHELLTPPIL